MDFAVAALRGRSKGPVALLATRLLRRLLHQRGLNPRAMDALRAHAGAAGAIPLLVRAMDERGSTALQAEACLALSYLVTGTGYRYKEAAGQVRSIYLHVSATFQTCTCGP